MADIPAFVWWGAGIALVFMFLIERAAALDEIEERRREIEHENELRRQGKTQHCDGWHVWWE